MTDLLIDELWYHFSIPVNAIDHHTLLIIPNFVLGIEVYLDDESIFKYGSFKMGPPVKIKRKNVQPLKDSIFY